MSSQSHLGILSEEAFIRRLHLEQRRTERSRRPFVFVLLESEVLSQKNEDESQKRLLHALSSSIRETDLVGWYEHGSAIGVIFTETREDTTRALGDSLVNKIRGLLERELPSQFVKQIHLSFYIFPDDWNRDTGTKEAVLYPDSVRLKRLPQVLKRCLDVSGSLLAMIVGAPLFLAIAAFVKLTSPGPVLYRQTRIGQYGREFTFLKFRSMYVNNDSAVHQKFVTEMIANGASGKEGSDKKVYKITNDRRITPIGTFLRKTSLDELPQFMNVLKGEMSLVGPRPPIPYEVQVYDIWHRRRLLGVKPGITGLWQVHGRCRTTFDEMVRLDLQYARTWSIWMDLKILLQTPRAVIAGDGAY
jgi:exopolysaccharide biosynthesis polyprenyl glycosylphosphotransferase